MCNGILFSPEKMEILPFTARMGLEGLVLSGISQTETYFIVLSLTWAM